MVVLSREDRALALSSFIAGAGQSSRLGDYKNAADLTQYNAPLVVDLSDVKSGDPAQSRHVRRTRQDRAATQGSAPAGRWTQGSGGSGDQPGG